MLKEFYKWFLWFHDKTFNTLFFLIFVKYFTQKIIIFTIYKIKDKNKHFDLSYFFDKSIFIIFRYMLSITPANLRSYDIVYILIFVFQSFHYDCRYTTWQPSWQQRSQCSLWGGEASHDCAWWLSDWEDKRYQFRSRQRVLPLAYHMHTYVWLLAYSERSKFICFTTVKTRKRYDADV